MERTEGEQFSLVGRDEVDGAAELIDETIQAVSEDRPFPDRLPKRVIPLLADLGKELRSGESLSTQSVRTQKPAVLTPETHERMTRLLELVYEDDVELSGEVRSADVDQRTFAIVDATGTRVPAKFDPSQEAEITHALHVHQSCRVRVVGRGEFAVRDASLKRVLRVDLFEQLTGGGEGAYDESAPPIWETIVSLGAQVPEWEWEQLPDDLSANLDHYLYGESGGE